MYGNYHIVQEYGCKHGTRGAYLICPVCGKTYGCEICHDEEEIDHTVKYKDVKEVVCCACGKRQEIGEKCAFCGQLFSNCYCPTCKNIYILDKDTEPYYHCDTCGTCHIFAQKEFTSRCEKCHQCVPISKLDEHECDDEICLVC